MTPVWRERHVDELDVEILTNVRQVDDSHHFGRPYMTAYQLAIKLLPGPRRPLRYVTLARRRVTDPTSPR